jgi:glycosyltransferase involved in cell wall biosynthesis
MSVPLISCLMLVREDHRRDFSPSALACFARQTWRNREIVVVGDRSITILGADLRVNHFERYNGDKTIGAKRNAGAAASHGSLIAHWDDDDWYSRRRLEDQAAAFTAGEDWPALSVARWCLFHDVDLGDVWMFEDPTDHYPNIGASLMYRREFWRANKFDPARHVGEDRKFIIGAVVDRRGVVMPEDLPARRHSWSPEVPLMVAREHGGNTSPRRASMRSAPRVWHGMSFSDLPEEYRLALAARKGAR